MSSPSSNEPENLHWSTVQPESNPAPSNHLETPMYQPNMNKLEDYDMPASDEVFVIMAGEESPSCLAKPMVAVASVARLCEQV
ncbi:hypothetical protein PVK06_032933 [Gossypium arboreum]|uniref:Uncharacterized protein n=1 Tax=Gossypium arboreum TaxID=29729 RepID=A0ABR0NVD7_GOSAR|nr:hypothetical protein PVK06_032933 [Gossypium arboreum]